MRIKRLIAPVLALCLLASLCACELKPAKPLSEMGLVKRFVTGSGNVTEKKTELSGDRDYTLSVSGVAIQGSDKQVELQIDESLEDTVSITADDNIIEHVIVNFDDPVGKISLYFTKKIVLSPTKLIIKVGVPVRKLNVSGAWNFNYSCPSVKDCDASISGTANGDFVFGTAERIKFDLSGAVNVSLKGSTQAAAFGISGTGNIHAFDLIVQTADIEISGAGNCEITAEQRLDAEISGLGKVIYDGEPEVQQAISGLGQVKHK